MRKNKTTANIVCEIDAIIRTHMRLNMTYEELQNVPKLGSYYIPVEMSSGRYGKKYDQIKDIPFKKVHDMKYHFAETDVHIGDAITEIVEFLEMRYDLDFYELEQEHLEKMKNMSPRDKAILAFFDSINITSGKRPN